MNAYTIFQSIANWIIGASVIIWLTVIIISWLASFRSPKAAPVGRSTWFRLPRWAQIISGISLFLLPLYRRARLEEITLADTFGAAWEAYAARTKFIIPFVY